MNYKGYEAHVVFDAEAGIFHGEVINTRDVITFQGESVTELKQAFQDSIDDYLDFCASEGREPEKPFSGDVRLRVEPELHRDIYISAKRSGKSMNEWLKEALRQSVLRAG